MHFGASAVRFALAFPVDACHECVYSGWLLVARVLWYPAGAC